MKTPGLECGEAVAEWIFDRYPAALCSDCPVRESWPAPHLIDHARSLRHWIIGRFGMPIGMIFNTLCVCGISADAFEERLG
jgi:hypothetical protein